MRMPKLAAASLLGVALAVVAGCGESRYVPVSGVVKLNGEPYPNAVVFFQPVGGKDNPNPGRGSSGVTDEKGRFSLKTPEGVNGAVVGEHQVKILTNEEQQPAPFDPNVGSPDNVPAPAKGKVDPIPLDWRTMGNHTFQVPAGGTDQANFDIESKARKK